MIATRNGFDGNINSTDKTDGESTTWKRGIQNPRLSWIDLVPRVLSWRKNLGTRLVLDYPELPSVGRNRGEKSSRHVTLP